MSAAGGGRSRMARAALGGAVAIALVAAAWLATSPPSDDLPLSPGSTASDGTRALTQILERLGAEVVVSRTPPERASTGLLLVDNISDDRREAWRDLARRGGTLVVVDAASELAPPPLGETAFGFVDPSLQRGCDLQALQGVSRVQAQGLVFDAPAEAVGCFRRGGGHWLVAAEEGEGAIVAVGGPYFLTNEGIGEADNAALAAALLAPREGDVVAIAPPDFATAEDGEGMLGVLPGGVWALLGQLLVAFLVVVWWRGRRLGAPVTEPQPVALPGSELVMGVGNLYAQRGAARHASEALRAQALRTVAARLRLEVDAEAGEAVEAAVAAGVERPLAEAALTDSLSDDDRALVALAGTVERLRAALDRVDDRRAEGVSRV